MDPRQSSLFRQQAFVDGSWIDAESGAVFAVRDPATGELLGHAPDMGASETRRAIAAAERALPLWRGKTAKERAQIMRRWFELILAEQETLAQIITAEQGKPLVEARGEILYGASFIDWFAEEGRRVYGDVLPIIGSDRRLLTFKQPVGVVAAITPWNFPSAMFARKVGAALGAGCAMVLKPAEQTPFSALALVELAQRAGVPDGVVNVVTALDPAPIGLEFARNPAVRKVTFTGSTEVGKILLRQAAENVQKCSMELGGNAPLIVFEDADFDLAIKGALATKYRNCGQTCVSANRILAHESIARDFAEQLAEAAGRLKVGDGREEGAVIGPLIEQAAVEKCERHVADAVARGATLLDRRRPPRAGRDLFSADGAGRRERGRADLSRGDLWPGGADCLFQGRSGCDPSRQRDALWTRLLFLQPRPAPNIPRRRGAGFRHGRRQRDADFVGNRAVRRDQAIGSRARGLALWSR